MAQGGKSHNDRVLSARVRTKALKEIEAILDEPGLTEYKKALLLKLSGTLLPRLNEHTGEDGEAISIKIISYGDNPPLQLSAENVSTTIPESDGSRNSESSDSVA